MTVSTTRQFLARVHAFLQKHYRTFQCNVYCKKHGVIIFSKVCGYREKPYHDLNGNALYVRDSYEELIVEHAHCCKRASSYAIDWKAANT